MPYKISSYSSADPRSISYEIIKFLYDKREKEEVLDLVVQSNVIDLSERNEGAVEEALKMGTVIQKRLDTFQLRERDLRAVIDNLQGLNKLQHIDAVLQEIVDRARKLMGADVAYLSFCDSGDENFYVRASNGTIFEKFKNVKGGLDFGICGHIARNKSPYSSSEYSLDTGFLHLLSIDTAVAGEGIESILGVPLLSGTDVIAVLFVANRHVHRYDGWEIQVLSTFAASACVSIENANILKQAQLALMEVNNLNTVLRKQVTDLEAVEEIREKQISLVVRGADINELCKMTASAVGKDVAIVDDSEQPICSSTTKILDLWNTKGEHYPIQDKIRSALVESRFSGRSTNLNFGGNDFLWVCAVVGRRGPLGGLLIRTTEELDELQIRIFEQSALIAGTVFPSQERCCTTNNRDHPLFLHSLLHRPQRNLSSFRDRLSRQGLSLDIELCLGVIEVPEEKFALTLKKLQGCWHGPRAVFEECDGVIVFITSVLDQEAINKSLREFFSKELRQIYSSVLSKPIKCVGMFPEKYESMLRCQKMLTSLGRSTGTFCEQELSLYGLLFEGKDSNDLRVFLNSTLGSSYECWRDRENELARTLLAYMDGGYNAGAAARAQGIHINTFRQRLDAINGLLGDWSSHAMEVHVALRLWKLSRQESAG